MALKSKTFRTTDDVFEALKNKSEEMKISESDIINKAVRCFLGLGIEENCTNYNELEQLKQKLESIIKLNNLKFEN